MQDRLTRSLCPWTILCLSAGLAMAQQGSAVPVRPGAGTTTTKRDIVGFGQPQQSGELTIAVQSVKYGHLDWPPAALGMSGGGASGVLVTVRVSFVASDSFQSFVEDASVTDLQDKTWHLTATKSGDNVNKFDGPAYFKPKTSGSMEWVLLFECPETVKPVKLEWKGLKPFGLLRRR